MYLISKTDRFYKFTFYIVLLTRICFSQADTWTQVISDGFGDSSQNTVPEMEVFNGLIYASTSPTGQGLAKLYRSETGDSGSWIDVTPPLHGDKSIHSFCTSTLDDGYIWCATGSPNTGAMIYRSLDVNPEDSMVWIPIAKRGMGDTNLTAGAPHMVIFEGTNDSVPYLYAGVGSHGRGFKGEVWRLPYNSTDSLAWEKLIDFDSVVTDHDVDLISYFYVWNDKIYFTTNGKGQLWESANGKTFVRNQGVGYGFGDATNIVISSMVSFNDYLYTTTTNMRGSQLWRTPDGITWDTVTVTAFGKRDSVEELRSLRTSFGKLWLTGYTDTSVSAGTPVWWSEDGVHFVQSNTDGFGDINNNGQNAITIGFGEYQYFGGPNYLDGGQIWRTPVSTFTNENLTNARNRLILSISFNTKSKNVIIQSEKPLTNSTIMITNIRGRIINTVSSTRTCTISIECKNLPDGNYIAYIRSNKFSHSGRFCILQ